MLFGFRKKRVLQISTVSAVRRMSLYEINERPVPGLEIVSGRKWIRFGAVLSEQEQRWLCGDILAFKKLHVPALKRRCLFKLLDDPQSRITYARCTCHR